MTDLPDGWAWAPLGDLLLRIEAGKSFRCEGRPARPEEWGIIKVSAMTWGKFQEQENKAVLADIEIDPANEIKPGDILLSRANTEAYVGAAVLVGECRPKLLLSDKSLRLVPSASVDHRWLVFLLSSPDIREEISRKATGTKDSMRNISQNSLKEIVVPVPPTVEQHRIVAALEDHLSLLDGAVDLLANTGDRIHILRRSALQELRYQALRDNPEMLPIGHIATTALGKMLDSKNNRGKSTPYLRNVNVRWGKVDLSNVDSVPMSEDQRVKFSLQKGDLLVCEGGEPGRCAIWPGHRDDISYQKALHRVRPGGKVSSEWLALMLEESIRNGRASHMFTGTTIKHLPQEKLRMLAVPVPSRSLQDEIIRKFTETARDIERFSGMLAALERRFLHMRRSLLTEAFAGRLVEQDPADEPASVLLERIQAERTAHGSARRGRRGTSKQAPQEETLV
ncbi:restriction endonuclease subunit S [Actinomadura parmotrematis]|uniref:Restriction endonuclease subunit S n=1 Tax=Actinomadura parmotrematis TaxID=2864039 RepID=A0ABS7FZT2_9ACTN|nr:restriction endonuclease subunit S [Actinomadura parmotrematis]MBW8485961.1 restriction endonuclease subunit S [Actinomadura parmotrematis]